MVDTNWYSSEIYFRLQTHLSFLKSQFELVGDDLANQTPTSTHQMTKESEHTYVLWCSGRQFCKGMLVQIKVFILNYKIL